MFFHPERSSDVILRSNVTKDLLLALLTTESTESTESRGMHR